jgi:hypothetical protein
MEEGMGSRQPAITEDFVDHEHEFEDPDAPVQTDADREAWAAAVVKGQQDVLLKLPR